MSAVLSSISNTHSNEFMTIYIVIIPQDYTAADAIPFRSEKEAREYIDEQVDKKYQHYATVNKHDV